MVNTDHLAKADLIKQAIRCFEFLVANTRYAEAVSGLNAVRALASLAPAAVDDDATSKALDAYVDACPPAYGMPYVPALRAALAAALPATAAVEGEPVAWISDALLQILLHNPHGTYDTQVANVETRERKVPLYTAAQVAALTAQCAALTDAGTLALGALEVMAQNKLVCLPNAPSIIKLRRALGINAGNVVGFPQAIDLSAGNGEGV